MRRNSDQGTKETGGRQRMRPAGRLERFESRFNADNLETRRVLAAVRAWLAAFAVSDDTLDTVELVLAEVLNNVVEHAYNDKSGPVFLSLSLHDDHIVCDVFDEGRPLRGQEPPNPPPPFLEPPNALPEGGFGWFIIRSLVSAIDYKYTNRCNHLSLTLPLAARPCGLSSA